MGDGAASRLAVRLYLPLALATLVVALYAGALRHPFMLDDHAAIVNHPDVTQPEGWWRLWSRAYQMPQRPEPGFYRPLTVLSYHLNARLTDFEPDPAAFRAVNVALLALLGWLVALWLSAWASRTAAWLAAFVFVAHPVQAEAIHLVSGRADLLALAGVVGFLWLQRRAHLAGAWSLPRALGAAGFALLAVGAKETGLVLVPAALAQAWIDRGTPAVLHLMRRRAAPTGEGWRRVRTAPAEGLANELRVDAPSAKPAAAAAVLDAPAPAPAPAAAPPRLTPVRRALRVILLVEPIVLYLLARALAVGWALSFPAGMPDLSLNPLRGAPWAQRVPAALGIAWQYVRHIVWPDALFNHVPAHLPTWSSPAALLGLAVVALAMVGLAACLRRRRFGAVPLALGLGHYLLVGNLVVASSTYASDRLALPIILVAAAGLAVLINRVATFDLRSRAMAAVPCAVVVVAMAGFTLVAIHPRWANYERLMRCDWESDPANPVTCYHYGTALIAAGRYDAAVAMLEAAVELRPDSLEARRRLAQAYELASRTESAENEYEEIVRRQPDDVPARLKLAERAVLRRQRDEARRHLDAVLAKDPTNAEARRMKKAVEEMHGNGGADDHR